MLWQAFGRWGAIGNSPTSGGALWTPDNLASDLEAWWDPEDGLTFGVAPNVNNWRDKIKSHSLDTISSAPQGLNTTQNGHYVMEFESTPNARMTATYACTSSTFMVCGMMRYKNGGSAFGRYLSFGSSARANDFGFDDVWQFSRSNLTSTISAERNGSFATAAPGYLTYFMYMIVFDGVNATLYIDDVSAGSAAKSGAFAITNFALCTSYDSTPGAVDIGQGMFGDIITMHRAPTTSERNKLFGWMAHKWGLTGNLAGGHPYKTSPPTV